MPTLCEKIDKKSDGGKSAAAGANPPSAHCTIEFLDFVILSFDEFGCS
jgi:hypothetical protein